MSKTKKYGLFVCSVDQEWSVVRRRKCMVAICAAGHVMQEVTPQALLFVQLPIVALAGEILYTPLDTPDAYELLINLGPADESPNEQGRRRWYTLMRIKMQESAKNQITIEADPEKFGAGHLLAIVDVVAVNGELALSVHDDTPCDISAVRVQRRESLPDLERPESRIFLLNLLPFEGAGEFPGEEETSTQEGQVTT